MQSTWGKTSFTSRVFLNLDFIIEAQIQAPKAAHTKFSLIQNMHSHLFIGYMATITFELKNVAIVKKCFTDWRSRLSVVMLSKCMRMYVGYVLNYYTTCAASHNSQREFTHDVFVCDKFNNMMNK